LAAVPQDRRTRGPDRLVAYWTWQILRFYFESFPYHMDMVGFDSRIYLHAAQTWLGAAIHGPHSHFGIPGAAETSRTTSPVLRRRFCSSCRPPGCRTACSRGGWMALTIGSAFYSLWRLRLPLWWILFPPLAQAVFVGNPHVVCLALILCGWEGLRILAPAAKAYACCDDRRRSMGALRCPPSSRARFPWSYSGRCTLLIPADYRTSRIGFRGADRGAVVSHPATPALRESPGRASCVLRWS